MFDPRKMTGQHFETVANPLKDEPEKKPKGRPRKAKEAAVTQETEVVPDQTGLRVGSDKTEPLSAEAPAEAAVEPIPLKQLPRTAAEYHAHLAIWLRVVSLPADIQAQWNAERKLRGDCGVIGEEMDAATAAKEVRLKELGLP
jgi:hypothetical protein